MPLIQGEYTMKNRIIKLFILLSITTLALTACGKDKTDVIEETVTEETVTPEITETSIVTEEPTPTVTETPEVTPEPSVTIAEKLDTKMYVVKESNILKLDQEGAGGIAPAEIGAYLTVTGKTTNGWYEVKWGEGKGYLPADVLSTENPIETPAPESAEDKETQDILDKFEEIMKGFDEQYGDELGGLDEVPEYEDASIVTDTSVWD